MQRLDFLSSKKRWEAEKAQQAMSLDDEGLVENSSDLRESSPGPSGNPLTEEELQEADAILQRENQELEALINSMDDDPKLHNSRPQQESNEEDDYDRIFMEYLAESDLRGPPAPSFGLDRDTDVMDTSDG